MSRHFRNLEGLLGLATAHLLSIRDCFALTYGQFTCGTSAPFRVGYCPMYRVMGVTTRYQSFHVRLAQYILLLILYFVFRGDETFQPSDLSGRLGR